MLNEFNKNTWCVNPYINLAVEPSGEMIPCCMSSKKYKTDKGSKTLDQEPIINFWNSKDRQDLIDQLENGIKAKGCEYCWKEEEAGKISKRQRDNQEWQGEEIKRDRLPAIMYLALGNLCNLKCRICYGDRSSVIADEEKKISFVNRTLFNIFHDQTSGQKSFSNDNDNFWENIFTLLPNVKRIDFSGGEPFYVKNHKKIIAHLVETGLSCNQILHYNTNGTIYPKDQIEILNNFKFIDISISIDGVNEKFEYIRHPAKFSEVDKNIDDFCQTRDKNNKKWSLQATLTISAFNIWDFVETFEYCRSKTLSVFLNFVHDGRGIKILPIELKNKIIERLLNHDSRYADWIHHREIVINYLNNHSFSKIQWKLFWREVSQRDKFRKESFKDTFPDYYREIEKYL